MFGADTDVGKTIFSTALALASTIAPSRPLAPLPRTLTPHEEGDRVAYLKPVSTGDEKDMDSTHVSKFAPHVWSQTLVQFTEPVSPHLAAEQLGSKLDWQAEDASLVRRIKDWMLLCEHEPRINAAILESAGGVHSPSPSGSSQADFLRPLRLPTILIGSSVLGGISTTRCSYESLRMRGYDVDAVLLFPSPHYQNDKYLAQFFADQGIRVFALGGPNQNSWGMPPARHTSTKQDAEQLQKYYLGMIHGNGRDDCMLDVVNHLRECHAKRYASLDTLGERAHQHMWWPFTQHTRIAPDDVTVIDSAHGDFFQTYEPSSSTMKPVLDGSASWWTQVIGHGHPRLALAAAYAAGRYGHVLSPGIAHAPAVTLTERLLGHHEPCRLAPGRGWASRVFFSDDGSTGMEVAIKMALQSSVRRYSAAVVSPTTEARIKPGRQSASLGGRTPREWEILGLQGSYHGDTIGAMDACEPSVFSEHVAWYRGRGYWFSPPTLRMKCGKVYVETSDSAEWGKEPQCLGVFSSIEEVLNVQKRLDTKLAAFYKRVVHERLENLVIVERRRFGALVLEPLVMGAGGMIFVDPLFQRCLVDVVREREDLFSLTDPPLRHAHMGRVTAARSNGEWRGLPVIFDEVFTGLRRLGWKMGADILGTTPDISCLAKILSGGLVPMSVTLASESIYSTFACSREKTHALLHGHSYTAHPVGCQVAIETLDVLEEMDLNGSWTPYQKQWSSEHWSVWDKSFVNLLSHADRVSGVMALGTLLKIELKTDSVSGYASDAANDLMLKLGKQTGIMEHDTTSSLSSHTFPLHLRSLGNVMYILTSLNTSSDVLRSVQKSLEREFL